MPKSVRRTDFIVSPTGRHTIGDQETATRRRALVRSMVERLVLPELLGRKDDGLFCPDRKVVRLATKDLNA